MSTTSLTPYLILSELYINLPPPPRGFYLSNSLFYLDVLQIKGEGFACHLDVGCHSR